MSGRSTPPPKSPIVFIHLPRTGGTTFHNLATNQFAADEMLHVTNWDEVAAVEQMHPAKKNKLRFLHGHVGFAFDNVLEQPHRYITFLRDPATRVASAYRYIRVTPQHTHHKIVTEGNLTLADFILQRVSLINIDNGMTRLLCGMPNNADQVGFGQCTPAMLQEAKKNLRERITVVGLTEQFDVSVVLMRRRFGWKSPLYTTTNATRGTAAETKLESEEIALIEKHNTLDRELYNYAKMLFTKQVLSAMPLLPLQVRYFQHKNRVRRQDQKAFRRLTQFEYKRIARWLDLK